MIEMTFDQTGDFVAVGAARSWLREQLKDPATDEEIKSGNRIKQGAKS